MELEFEEGTIYHGPPVKSLDETVQKEYMLLFFWWWATRLLHHIRDLGINDKFLSLRMLLSIPHQESSSWFCHWQGVYGICELVEEDCGRSWNGRSWSLTCFFFLLFCSFFQSNNNHIQFSYFFFSSFFKFSKYSLDSWSILSMVFSISSSPMKRSFSKSSMNGSSSVESINTPQFSNRFCNWLSLNWIP